ncbi:MAG: hemerythrin domain-containing protein [Elusimicrobia bacterium]|nr:hemerythrin domain-containing protein [Elusimicrobiota bacterium]
MTEDLISAFFEQDHSEIDRILGAVAFDAPEKAVPAFAEFDRRLERHIEWEEKILFPAVGAKAPALEGGPLRVMRFEHEQIRGSKATAASRLRAGDSKGARRAVDEMLAVLEGHNMKEEEILYPACDRLLTDAERKAILDRVRAKTEA